MICIDVKDYCSECMDFEPDIENLRNFMVWEMRFVLRIPSFDAKTEKDANRLNDI